MLARLAWQLACFVACLVKQRQWLQPEDRSMLSIQVPDTCRYFLDSSLLLFGRNWKLAVLYTSWSNRPHMMSPLIVFILPRSECFFCIDTNEQLLLFTRRVEYSMMFKKNKSTIISGPRPIRGGCQIGFDHDMHFCWVRLYSEGVFFSNLHRLNFFQLHHCEIRVHRWCLTVCSSFFIQSPPPV